MIKDRFVFQRSQDDGYVVCTDTKYGIVCKFEFGKFNETQKFTPLDDDYSQEALENMPTIMREFGDYLATNHYFASMPYDDMACRAYTANLVKNTRESKGWTIYRLHIESGISQSNIARIENGEYSARFDTIVKLLHTMNKEISIF